jgi:hypothetical protein
MRMSSFTMSPKTKKRKRKTTAKKEMTMRTKATVTRSDLWR